MANSLAILPSEILSHILHHCSAEDLARIRLVSSRFRKAASRLLFRKLICCHTPQSAANVASVIASEDLRAYVREFFFSERIFSDSQVHEFPKGSSVLPAQILHTLHRVSLLDNLSVLRVSHDGPQTRYPDQHWITKKVDTCRGEILKTLVISLAERGATSRKLETLDILNLPCRSQPYLTDHPSFSALLRILQTLLLRFAYDPDLDDHYDDHPRREFFTRLPQAWLAPASTNLTCLGLGLGDSGPWGYLLKVDFRGVHFPRLKSLTMQDFVFSHDWQLEWILSHTSLQELCLFRCRILTHALWYGEEDTEGYPTGSSGLEEDVMLLRKEYHYARSWYHYYQQFSLLGNLTSFTTVADDESAPTYAESLYESLEQTLWCRDIPEPDRSAEDEEGLKHLKATTNRRLRH